MYVHTYREFFGTQLMICINQVRQIKMLNNNDRVRRHRESFIIIIGILSSLFLSLRLVHFMSSATTTPSQERAESVFAPRRLFGSVREGGGEERGGGDRRGGREANRKAPSVSVTGALLTGNFFRGQVVPSRHATNQAGRAAGSDYKKGRDCADMFIRSHKLRWYAEVRIRPGGKGARNNTESLHFFRRSPVHRVAAARDRGAGEGKEEKRRS